MIPARPTLTTTKPARPQTGMRGCRARPGQVGGQQVAGHEGEPIVAVAAESGLRGSHFVRAVVVSQRGNNVGWIVRLGFRGAEPAAAGLSRGFRAHGADGSGTVCRP